MEKHVGRYSRQASPCGSLVELRDHPLMQYRGARNGPPAWSQVGDELGVLKQVNGDRRSTQRFYVVVEHEGESERFCSTMRSLVGSFPKC